MSPLKALEPLKGRRDNQESEIESERTGIS